MRYLRNFISFGFALCCLNAAATAVSQPLPAEVQIAAAVIPLPEVLREGAAVLGYAEDGTLVTLRDGSNEMTCLADDPSDEGFHVACYHRSLEPFMERGRQLRAEGMERAELVETRREEVEAGTLSMPTHPAALYSITAPAGSFDPETRTVTEGRKLYVIYVPYATAEDTGLPTDPGPVWLMNPGEPWAHIMISAPAGDAMH